jgi:phosphoglycerate-specific signal transduction histidine kinase
MFGRDRPLRTYQSLQRRCRQLQHANGALRARVREKEAVIENLKASGGEQPLHDVTAEPQAERLAAIGETATGLAHEIRNAMQRMQACLEMLVLELQDRPESLDLLGRMQAAQDRLQHLHEQVLEYSAPHRDPARRGAEIMTLLPPN